MKEGWIGDLYLILFEDTEWREVTESYCIEEFLPGYRVAGLLGWDDFLLVDEAGQRFRVPTVPLVKRYIEPYTASLDLTCLESDERFTGKIKWYITPIVFGGDANSKENMTWIDILKHQRITLWWNRKYRELSDKNRSRS